MAYELFLTTFDRAETAGEARSWLHEFVCKGDLQVLDVVELANRDDDSAVIRQIGDLGSKHGSRIGAVLGGLLGVAGGPVAIAALGAAGAAFGSASELLGSRDLYKDDLQEFEQALTPGTSALLVLVAPEHTNMYTHAIADFGGETMRFGLTNDAGQEFQNAKHAFIARQSERRQEQLAAWRGTTGEEAVDLEAMNRELAQIYGAMNEAAAVYQADLRVHAAALRTRRDNGRELLNQTLVAEIQRLDETITSYQQAVIHAESADQRATLAAQYEALRDERLTVQQQLEASQNSELQERWRDITAMETLAARADRATRIELTLLLAQLRDGYAAARQVHSKSRANAA